MLLVVFTISMFVSASLLFLVEPMLAKMALPLLGGSPAVWNTCLVFFQAVLLAGYLYAHATTKWLGRRTQIAVHICVALLPFAVWLAQWRHGGLVKNTLSVAICLLGVGWFSVRVFNLKIPGFG